MTVCFIKIRGVTDILMYDDISADRVYEMLFPLIQSANVDTDKDLSLNRIDSCIYQGEVWDKDLMYLDIMELIREFGSKISPYWLHKIIGEMMRNETYFSYVANLLIQERKSLKADLLNSKDKTREYVKNSNLILELKHFTNILYSNIKEEISTIESKILSLFDDGGDTDGTC